MQYYTLSGYLKQRKQKYIKKAVEIHPDPIFAENTFENHLLGADFQPATPQYISGWGSRFFKAIKRGAKAVGRGIKRGAQAVGRGIKKGASWAWDKLKDGNLQASPESVSYESPNITASTQEGRIQARSDGGGGGGGGWSFDSKPPRPEQEEMQQQPPQQNNTLLYVIGGAALLMFATMKK